MTAIVEKEKPTGIVEPKRRGGRAVRRQMYTHRAFREWTSNEIDRHPYLPKEYAKLLLDERLLPSPDRASGFTFFSPAAHLGFYEYNIAKKLDDTLSHEPKQPEKPPLFIAADMVGEYRGKGYVPMAWEVTPTTSGFVPGFRKDMFDPEDFKYVSFQKVSAEADEIFLRDGSVDIVWDGLGALWHAQEERIRSGESDKTIVDLLNEYRRVLKPNGCVIIDAAEITKGVDMSTFRLLTTLYYSNARVDFEQLGWTIDEIGSGEARLVVLKPKDAQTA